MFIKKGFPNTLDIVTVKFIVLPHNKFFLCALAWKRMILLIEVTSPSLDGQERCRT